MNEKKAFYSQFSFIHISFSFLCGHEWHYPFNCRLLQICMKKRHDDEEMEKKALAELETVAEMEPLAELDNDASLKWIKINAKVIA